MKKSVVAKGYKTRAGAARAVFSGRKMKTVGGLTKDKLTKSKSGKIVSKKQQANGKKAYNKYLAKWNKAVQAARKALGDESLCLWLLQNFYISIEEASSCRILFLTLIISKNT